MLTCDSDVKEIYQTLQNCQHADFQVIISASMYYFLCDMLISQCGIQQPIRRYYNYLEFHIRITCNELVKILEHLKI